jgi:hypothetical protein
MYFCVFFSSYFSKKIGFRHFVMTSSQNGENLSFLRNMKKTTQKYIEKYKKLEFFLLTSSQINKSHDLIKKIPKNHCSVFHGWRHH